LSVQLVSKIFNLCGHDPPTSQTDRRTDDKRSLLTGSTYGSLNGHYVTTPNLTRSHPEMVGDMSRVTLNFDPSKIPFMHF